MALLITYHPIHDGAQVVTTAQRLGRRSAYDAAYLVLAQQISAELWTFDGPFARQVQSLGSPMHLVQ